MHGNIKASLFTSQWICLQRSNQKKQKELQSISWKEIYRYSVGLPQCLYSKSLFHLTGTTVVVLYPTMLLKSIWNLSTGFILHSSCSHIYFFFLLFKAGATLWQRKLLLSKVCAMITICDGGEHSYTDLSHSSVFSLLEVPLCGSDGM